MRAAHNTGMKSDVDLSKYYHLRQRDAANKIGVSVTTFIRMMREYGIKKWPYRTIKMINKLTDASNDTSNDTILNIYKDPNYIDHPDCKKYIQELLTKTQTQTKTQRRSLSKDIETVCEEFSSLIFKRPCPQK